MDNTHRKKVLFIANHKGFSKFNAPFMAWFKEQGWQVDNASPGIEIGDVDCQYDVDIQRTPFSWRNYRAYKRLKTIIELNHYDLIHVHTPMGAALGRLAAIKARKKGTKVIYTAHGFHFFKGAALKNWLLYYPMERLLSSFTDAVVTINDEDFERAKKLNLAHGNIFHIDGVGVNLERFHPISKIEKHEIRKKIGLRDSDFVVLYVAQFIPRKNHQLIIHQIQNIVKTVPDFKVVFAGNGETLLQCKTLAEQMGVSKYIMFLGGRSDIPDLCGMADIHVSPSLQEGLDIGNIEAMATGCPLVLSNIRGHREVCRDGINGYLFDLNDPQKMTDSIIVLFQDKERYELIKATNLHDVHKFSVDCSVKSMAGIYKSVVE